MLKEMHHCESILNGSSEIAICFRQRLLVSVGNFQRAKHEVFITANGIRGAWMDGSLPLQDSKEVEGVPSIDREGPMEPACFC